MHPSSRSENVASACRVVKTRQQISIGTAGKSALKVENLSSYTLLKGHTLKESKDIAPQGGKFTDICMVGRAVTPPTSSSKEGMTDDVILHGNFYEIICAKNTCTH